MRGKYLLDTNIVIALFAEDPSVQKRIAKAAEVFIPAIVIGELFFGAFKSGRPKANSARIENFAAGNAVLACGIGTSRDLPVTPHLLKTYTSLTPSPSST
jgi:tRNA(fMet)-specific endonuclease VapC